MSNILGRALIKKKKLESELARVNDFIVMYRDLDSGTKNEHEAAAATNFLNIDSSRMELKSDNVDILIDETSKEFEAPVTEIKKGVRGTPPDEIVPMIEDIMIAKGQPMTRSEVLKKLLEDGVDVGGRDKSKNIGTILWRKNKKFVSLTGHGYWLKNRPCRDVGYFPEDAKSEGDLI